MEVHSICIERNEEKFFIYWLIAFKNVTFLSQVQTGFGRMGTTYWGFEDAGVTPDIGKNI